MTEKEEYYHLTEQFEPVSNMLFASQGNGSYLTVIGAVNTLNTLIYANEQLDKENQQLDEKVCALTMDLVTTKSYKQLEKENVRLKDTLVAAKASLTNFNSLKKENEQLKQRINSRLHFYRELYESTNDDVVKRVVEDLEDILR